MKIPPIPPTPPIPPSASSGGGGDPSVEQMEELMNTLMSLLQQVQQIMQESGGSNQQVQIQALTAKMQQVQTQMQNLVGNLPPSIQAHVSEDVSKLSSPISKLMNGANGNSSVLQPAITQAQVLMQQLEQDLNN